VFLSHQTGVIEIGLVVRDLEASMRFYGETLRLAYIGELPLPGGEMRRFAHGDAVRTHATG
jgi:catechol 2,3-dioxygenase-like lactoylglutathione lyase family enzyme